MYFILIDFITQYQKQLIVVLSIILFICLIIQPKIIKKKQKRALEQSKEEQIQPRYERNNNMRGNYTVPSFRSKEKEEPETERIIITQATYFWGVEFLDRRVLALRIRQPKPTTHLKTIQSNDKGEVIRFITKITDGRVCVGIAICENNIAKCIFLESIETLDIHITNYTPTLDADNIARLYDKATPHIQEIINVALRPFDE